MADFEVSGTASLDVDRMLESVERVITKFDELMNKLSEVDEHIDEMENKEVRIDVVIEHQDRLEELVVFLDDIDSNTYDVAVRINIEGDDRLDLLRIHIDELTRDRHTINIDINTEHLDETELRIAALNRQLDRLNRREREAADGGREFQFSLALLAPLLLPVSAGILSIVGAAGGLAASFVGMAGPVLAVGLATRSAYTEITTFASTLSGPLQDALAGAGQNYKEMFSILDKNSSTFRNMNRDVQDTVVQYFQLKNAVKSFENAVQPQTMGILTNGMATLREVLKDITPAAQGAGNALEDLLADLANRMQDPTFQKFFSDIDSNIYTLVTDWGEGVLNIIEGITAILDAFLPMGVKMSGGFLGMTQSFDTWAQHLAQSDGFKKFVHTVETDGPIILGILSNVVRFIANLVGALGESSLNKGFLDGLLKGLQTLNKFTSTHQGLTQISADLLLIGVSASKLGPALGPLMDFIASPVGLVVVGILAMGAALIYAYNSSKQFRDWVNANLVPILHKLVGDAKDVAQWFKGIWPDIQRVWQMYGKNILNIVIDAFKWIEQVISGAVTIIEGIIDVFLGLLTGNWSKVWTGLGKIVDGAWRIIEQTVSTALKIVGNLMAMMWKNITTDVSSAWDGIYRTFTRWGSNIISSVTTMFKNVVSHAASGMGSFLTSVESTGAEVASWFSGLPGNIVKWLGSLGGVLIQAGKDLIHGFLDGIKSAAGDVKSFLSGFTSLLPGWKGPPEKDAVLLYGAGQLLISGFINGLESKYNAVENSLRVFTRGLGSTIDKNLTMDVTSKFNGSINTSAGVAGILGRPTGYGNGAAGSQVSFGPGAIQINNPVPEPASTSLTRAMQTVSQMGTIQTPHGFNPTVSR